MITIKYCRTGRCEVSKKVIHTYYPTSTYIISFGAKGLNFFCCKRRHRYGLDAVRRSKAPPVTEKAKEFLRRTSKQARKGKVKDDDGSLFTYKIPEHLVQMNEPIVVLT